MARTDWVYIQGSTNNNSAFFTGIRWKYRDDLFGTSGYPSDRVSSNTDIIEYQPYIGRKQSYGSYSYTQWRTSYYRYSYNTTSGSDPGTAENNLNISTTFRFDKASNNTKYYPVHGSLSSGNVFNTSATSLSRIIQVPHCSDGTSKVRLFFHFTGDSNTSFSYAETNGVITLETIPRASSITVNDANIGSATSIILNKASDTFTTTISYFAEGMSDYETIVEKTPSQLYGWIVPTSFYALIPNTKTINCTFSAKTYNGDEVVGINTYTATFTATGNPVINSSSATDTNSTTIALTGDNSKMIRYGSNVQISVSASGQNSASVSSISVNGNELVLSGTTTKTGSITINKANTNQFEIIVTDSRGYTTTNIKTMDMIDYVPLTINASVDRNEPTDSKVKISYNGAFFNDTFGTENNTLTVQYRYKESTASTWENWTNLTPTITNNSYSETALINDIDYTKNYNFEIRAIDEIDTKTIEGIVVTKGEPIYYWDEDGLYVNGKLELNNNSVATGEINDATITIQKNGTDIETFTTNDDTDKTINIQVQELSVEEGTGIVTRTSGASLESSSYAKYGNIVTLSIAITTTASVSAGSNVFQGTVDNNFAPRINAGGTSYNGSSGLLGYIDENGDITIRVIGSSIASGRPFNIVFTYVI